MVILMYKYFGNGETFANKGEVYQMNKMGIFQRFWCLLVTIVLLLTAAGIIPESKQRAAEARWAGDTLLHTDTNQTLSNKLQYTKTTSGSAGTTGHATMATMKPQSTKAPAAKRKGSSGSSTSSKSPNSIPVAAPAADQIITSMKVMATGYTAGYESTGKTPKHPEYGITYSGVKVRRDKNTVSTIAADPKVLPLGSILYIPDYGYAIVADTGSAIKGQKIDLYFATTKQVYKEWGKKSVVVQLIKRGDGKCTEGMLKKLSKAIETYKTVPQSLLEETI